VEHLRLPRVAVAMPLPPSPSASFVSAIDRPGSRRASRATMVL
jgi:hypothetical protein